MIKEITNWWLDGEISDENYIKSLKILSGKADDKNIIPKEVFKNSAILMLTEPRHDYHNETLSNYNSNQITENFSEINLSITKNQTNLSASDEKIFLQDLQMKANSWRENSINDDEFLSGIANILDSSGTSLFLKSLENLSFDELISHGNNYQMSGEYRNALSFYDQALMTKIDSNEMKIIALSGKGSALISLGEYDKALEQYDLALDLEPNNIDLLKKKAFTLAQLGLLDAAVDYFELANEIKSK
jgi:tetratricopeptide (TPR) repeat protein